MLTINNFDKQINETTLNKGIKYYQGGAVMDVEEIDDNTWTADVEGSRMYLVEVTLNNNHEISQYTCNCPVGGACKHVIATFYAIREEIGKRDPKQKKTKRQDVFSNLLQKITLKEYQAFASKYAAKNKDFKTDFELWFADKDASIDVGKKYADLVKKIIRNNTSHGYVDYSSSFSLSNEVEKLIHTGHEFITKSNFRDAFAIARPVFTEMVNVIKDCDDSDGEIGGTIESATTLVEEIIDADGAALDLYAQIFDFLKAELDNRAYFDYGDFGYDLFAVFQKLAAKLKYTDEFVGFVDEQILKLNEGSSTYKRDFFNKQKIAFFKATGKTDEVEHLILQNMDIVEVRQSEVNKALAKKDFMWAKKLISEGIKIAERLGHPGTVSQWEKELLRIAVSENDTETIRHYAKRFAFGGWGGLSKEYYNQWKKTYSADKWKEVIEAHIEDRIKNITAEHAKNKSRIFYKPHPPLLSNLGPVYIEEQYWERILPLVKQENTLEKAIEYHPYLVKKYPTEMLEIYLPAFEAYGDKANTRNEYADLASKMKKVIKDIPEGKDRIMGVVQILKTRYSRRPAMVEELNKIGK